MLYGVILAGGSGTRLWPESRKKRPKQFFRLDGKRTILSETVERVFPLLPPSQILVLTSEGMVPMVRESLGDRYPLANILTEPYCRNTAGAIGLAALEVIARNPEATMVVLPSDHFIEPADKFCDVIAAASAMVDEDPKRVITIGIDPTFPSIHYGYIETSAALDSAAAIENRKAGTFFDVASFHEKPDKETAQNYISTGRYLWNAGIFIWKAKRVLELFNEFQPEIGARLETIRKALYHDDADEILRKNYEAMESVSVDIAIMEKASNLIVVNAPIRWNDIGSFESLNSVISWDRDGLGNLSQGIDLESVASNGNIIRWNPDAPDEIPTLLALVGVNDLEIIRQGNAILVTRKGNDLMIRKLVEKLRQEGKEDYL